MVDAWLVRTEKNFLSGPFPAQKVREMIQSGELGYQDEVSSAHGYWFYIHEVDEVKKQLGIDVPRDKSREVPSEDATLTEFDLDEDYRSQSGMARNGKSGRGARAPGPDEPQADPDLPELDGLPGTLGEGGYRAEPGEIVLNADDHAPEPEPVMPAQSMPMDSFTPSASALRDATGNLHAEIQHSAELMAKESTRRLVILLSMAIALGCALAGFLYLFRA